MSGADLMGTRAFGVILIRSSTMARWRTHPSPGLKKSSTTPYPDAIIPACYSKPGKRVPLRNGGVIWRKKLNRCWWMT